MNKRLFQEIFFSTILLFLLCPVFYGGANPLEMNPIDAITFGDLFFSVMRGIFWMATIFSPVLVIAGGIIMLLAGTDPSKIVLGKKVILYAVIIFGIILMLKIIAFFFRGEVAL